MDDVKAPVASQSDTNTATQGVGPSATQAPTEQPTPPTTTGQPTQTTTVEKPTPSDVMITVMHSVLSHSLSSSSMILYSIHYQLDAHLII